MTVHVDDARIPATVRRRRALWSHLSADTDDELHDFAARLGLRRAWFQDDVDPMRRHYDLTESKRRTAIALGAHPETWRAGARRRLAARHPNHIGPGRTPVPQGPDPTGNGSTGNTAPALERSTTSQSPIRPSARSRRPGGTW